MNETPVLKFNLKDKKINESIKSCQNISCIKKDVEDNHNFCSECGCQNIKITKTRNIKLNDLLEASKQELTFFQNTGDGCFNFNDYEDNVHKDKNLDIFIYDDYISNYKKTIGNSYIYIVEPLTEEEKSKNMEKFFDRNNLLIKLLEKCNINYVLETMMLNTRN